MMKYSLRCAEGHGFDSWFASAEAFDKLAAGGMLSCAVCGSASVEKALMAPRLSAPRAAPVPAEPPSERPPERPLSSPAHPAEQALAELRRKIEAHSTFVGRDFAREARAMHLGDAPERPIHGEATGAEARSLLDEGVPILPLPFSAGRKGN